MTLKEVMTNLCYHDMRNPDFDMFTEHPKFPVEDCKCDNCFYGRSELAEIIMKMASIRYRLPPEAVLDPDPPFDHKAFDKMLKHFNSLKQEKNND